MERTKLCTYKNNSLVEQIVNVNVHLTGIKTGYKVDLTYSSNANNQFYILKKLKLYIIKFSELRLVYILGNGFIKHA